MAPSRTVTTVQAEDLNEIVDGIVASKHKLAISMVLVNNFPDTEGRRRSTESSVRDAFRNPDCTNLKVIDDQTGELLGYLTFERKRAQEVTQELIPVAGQRNGKLSPDPPLAAVNLDVLNVLVEGAKKISEYTAGMDHFGKHDAIFVHIPS